MQIAQVGKGSSGAGRTRTFRSVRFVDQTRFAPVCTMFMSSITPIELYQVMYFGVQFRCATQVGSGGGGGGTGLHSFTTAASSWARLQTSHELLLTYEPLGVKHVGE